MLDLLAKKSVAFASLCNTKVMHEVPLCNTLLLFGLMNRDCFGWLIFKNVKLCQVVSVIVQGGENRG